jgi:hypothetical protein
MLKNQYVAKFTVAILLHTFRKIRFLAAYFPQKSGSGEAINNPIKSIGYVGILSLYQLPCVWPRLALD